MITCVLFSVFCYADTYTFYLMYLNYEESLLGDKGDPTLEIKYKKTLRKKEIFSGYVGVFAYLITLLEFYELKYLVFYLGLYYSHKFVYVISPLSAKVYKRISNPNFLDVYYVLGFVLSIFLIILKLYKS